MPRTQASDDLHAMKYRGPREDFDEAVNRVSFGLADNGHHYHALRDIMLPQRFCPGGRVQGAIGATRQTTAQNCYVSRTIDDSIEGIMDALKEAALTSKMGGGIGYDFSTIRPKGYRVKKIETDATGPVSFMEYFNTVGLGIASSGHRRGAQMAILRVDHPDVEEFIRAKQKPGALEGFNVSVAVTDKFMEAVAHDQLFPLSFGGSMDREVRAVDLWQKIMRATWDWAEPGCFFIDTVNRMNNLWYCEQITATNPCIVGETLVQVAGRGPVSIKQLAREKKDVPIFAVNPKTGETVVRWGRKPRLTKKNAKLVKVTLDDGSFIRCTPDHKFPLRNGKKVMAKNLKDGDSLFRFDSTLNKKGDRTVEGRPEYHLIAEAKYGRKFNFGRKKGEYHAHHIDGDHQNNDWDNIEVKFAEDHNRDHKLGDDNPMRFWWNGLSETEKSVYREKMSASTSGPRNGMWGQKHSVETLRKIGVKTSERLTTPEARKKLGEAVSAGMTKEVRKKISDSRIYMFVTLDKRCLHCNEAFSIRVANETTLKAKRQFCSRSCSLIYRNQLSRGVSLTKARRQQISRSLKGRPHSNEHNAKVSAALKGRNKSDLHRLAISKAAARRTDIKRNERGQYINHKVLSVVLDGYGDVYNLTVDEFHNYSVITSEGFSRRWKNRTTSGIKLSNCGEQPLPPFGACLLGSFNLPAYLKKNHHPPMMLVADNAIGDNTAIVPSKVWYKGDPSGEVQFISGGWYFDFDQLRADIPHVVRGMDNVVDRTLYPLPEQKAEAKAKRRMGLGVMGLANAGEALGFPYGSVHFLQFEATVLEVIRDGCYRASADLAKEKGAFPLYNEVKYPSGNFIATLPDDIQDLIRKQGIRNSHLTSIAPTGTISMCADNVSGGIEPVFAHAYRRPVNTPTGKVDMTIEDYGVAFLGIKGKLSADVTPQEHVDVLVTAQRYVDSAVSKTCNTTGETPWGEFTGIYSKVHAGGGKGCTTFNRDGKRGTLITASTPVTADDGPNCAVDPETGRRDCA